MALSTYIRDKNTGQAYQLQASGYYKPISAPGAGSVDVNGINDVFSQTAAEEAAKTYDPMVETATNQNTRETNDLNTKLAALYSDRGMGNSSFYTGDVKATNLKQADSLKSSLAQLNAGRQNYINSRIGNLQNVQQTGTYNDWKAEQDRIAAERAALQAQQLHDQQMELLKAQTSAYSGGSSSGSGSSKSSGDVINRVAGTDDVTVNGERMTREDAASYIANTTDRNSAAWKKAAQKMYLQFPSIVKPAQKTVSPSILNQPGLSSYNNGLSKYIRF